MSGSAGAGWWRSVNLVDRMYFTWFSALSLLIPAFRERLPAWPTYLALHAVCVAVIALLAAETGRRVFRFLHDWYPLAMFIVCFEEVARLSLLVVPRWQDAALLELEARIFPVPPTAWFGRFSHLWWATEVMELGYFSYFVLLMIVGGVFYGWRDRRPFRQVMAASVLSYLLCYVVFILWPTEGPAHTLKHLHTTPVVGGPFHWLVLLIQKNAGVHGNAFPSSHVAAGLVALLYAWKYKPRLGWWLAPLVLFLCLGAVYDRYHYLSDVVAGLLWGAAAYGIVQWIGRRPRLAERLNLYPD